jgi:uncharacterized membrane protein YphA (DoxX/SURF4 family)
MLVFGIQHFIFANFAAGLGPPWSPRHPFWTYFTGVALVAAGVSIATKKQARLAAILLGVMFFRRWLLFHVPRLAAHPHHPGEWTSASEILAMCGAALVLGGTLPAERPHFQG